MLPAQTKYEFNQIQQAILLAVAYADVFDFPLTVSEIHRYCGVKTSFAEIAGEIRITGLLSQVGEFFTLPGREYTAAMRLRRAEISARLWPYAIQYGKIIASLPYIRMVSITGSLAVNNTKNQADIDYMIVTEPGHLWTCRALVIALSQVAARQGFNLCPNYLITTRALKLTDRTLYVAHELAQMIPLSGIDVYARMRNKNAWVADFLPNAAGLPSTPVSIQKAEFIPRARAILEKILKTSPGIWLERWEMNRKIQKLSRTQKGSIESIFSAEVCKGHDQGHQTRAQELYQTRVSMLMSAGLEISI